MTGLQVEGNTQSAKLANRLLSVRRDTVALTSGTAICVVAGLYPWFEVPSAEYSWVDAEEMLRIVTVENPFSVAGRIMLLMFALTSTLLLAFRFRQLRTIRHAAAFLLLAYLMAPQLILNFSADDLRNSQIVYNHTDRVITDMELNLIHQQADWRAFQSFTAVAKDYSSLIEEPAFENWNLGLLSWSGQEELFDQILGLSNSFLNLASRGWYGAIAGLLLWLLGAYSGGMLPRRARAFDARFVPVMAIAMILVSPFPRAMAEIRDRSAMYDLAAGDYPSAAANLDGSSFWSPIRDLSIGYQAQRGPILEQLNCVSCPGTLIAQANVALFRRNYIAASTLLDRVAGQRPDAPGLRYWRALAHVGLGFDLFNVGQYSAADRQFALGLDLVPVDSLAWYGRAMAQLRMRNEDKAAGFLGEAVRIQEYLNFQRLTLRSQWYLLKSWANYRAGRLGDAHADYVLQLSPESWP